MLKIIPLLVTKLVGPVMVQVGGVVMLNGIGTNRNVAVFSDRGLSRFLGMATSDATTGAWSLSCLGGGGSRFTAVAIGNQDENDIIFADCVE
jgi:hypothetical protein